MRALAAALVLAFVASFAVVLGPADARSEEAAIRSVIESQIEAFRADDGPRAYSYAAPGIKDMFRDDTRFMAMVRQGYRPVYRPRDYTFGALRDTPHGPVQEVFVVDEAGVSWVALYSLEQQPDGSWKISGCHLVRRPELNA